MSDDAKEEAAEGGNLGAKFPLGMGYPEGMGYMEVPGHGYIVFQQDLPNSTKVIAMTFTPALPSWFTPVPRT